MISLGSSTTQISSAYFAGIEKRGSWEQSPLAIWGITVFSGEVLAKNRIPHDWQVQASVDNPWGSLRWKCPESNSHLSGLFKAFLYSIFMQPYFFQIVTARRSVWRSRSRCYVFSPGGECCLDLAHRAALLASLCSGASELTDCSFLILSIVSFYFTSKSTLQI